MSTYYQTPSNTNTTITGLPEPESNNTQAMTNQSQKRIFNGSNLDEFLIRDAAKRHGVDENLALSIAQTESSGKTNAVSPKGAKGLFQLMPDTAKDLGVADPFDSAQNIDGGVRYLKQLSDRHKGDVDKTLASYNWGMGNVEREGLEKAPTETKNYIKTIKGKLGLNSAVAPEQTEPTPIAGSNLEKFLTQSKQQVSQQRIKNATLVTNQNTKVAQPSTTQTGKVNLPVFTAHGTNTAKPQSFSSYLGEGRPQPNTAPAIAPNTPKQSKQISVNASTRQPVTAGKDLRDALVLRRQQQLEEAAINPATRSDEGLQDYVKATQASRQRREKLEEVPNVLTNVQDVINSPALEAVNKLSGLPEGAAELQRQGLAGLTDNIVGAREEPSTAEGAFAKTVAQAAPFAIAGLLPGGQGIAAETALGRVAASGIPNALKFAGVQTGKEVLKGDLQNRPYEALQRIGQTGLSGLAGASGEAIAPGASTALGTLANAGARIGLSTVGGALPGTINRISQGQDLGSALMEELPAGLVSSIPTGVASFGARPNQVASRPTQLGIRLTPEQVTTIKNAEAEYNKTLLSNEQYNPKRKGQADRQALNQLERTKNGILRDAQLEDIAGLEGQPIIKLVPEQQATLESVETAYKNSIEASKKLPENVKNKDLGRAKSQYLATRRQILSNAQIDSAPIEPVTGLTPEAQVTEGNNTPIEAIPGSNLAQFLESANNNQSQAPKVQPIETAKPIAEPTNKTTPITSKRDYILDVPLEGRPNKPIKEFTDQELAQEVDRVLALRTTGNKPTPADLKLTEQARKLQQEQERREMETPTLAASNEQVPAKAAPSPFAKKPLPIEELRKLAYGENSPQQLQPKPATVKPNEPAPTKETYPPEVQAKLDAAKTRHKQKIDQANKYSGGDKQYAASQRTKAGFDLSTERKQILADYEQSKAQQPVAEVKPATTQTLKPQEAPNEQLGKPSTQPKPTVKPLAEGNTAKASTERGTEIEAQYKLVEADQLNASHDIYLKENPNYPQELQPRDRSRAASEDQITRISKGLKPEYLGASPKVSDGSPIVDEGLTVESGNGRTIALQRAYNENGQNAGKYRQYLIDNAKEFGIDPEAIKNAKKPVLVRVRKTQVDRAQFVTEANETSVARMSASEQGKSDAKKLGTLLENFKPSDEGDILTGDNQKGFIPQFLDKVVGIAERGQYLDAKGNVTQDGITRIKNAIFAKAYADTPEGTSLLQKISESPDSNIRNIGGALLKQAGKFATLKEDIAQGNRYDLDISQDITAAVAKISSLREQGASVADYLKQQGLFGDELSPLQKDILQTLENNKRSPKKLNEVLDRYTQLANSVGDPKQQSLFGENNIPTREELFILAQRTDGQEKLFQRASGQAGRSSALPKTVKYKATPELPKGVTKADLRLAWIKRGMRDENGQPLNAKQVEERIDNILYVMDALARSTGKTPDQFYRETIQRIELRKGGANDKGATQFLDNGQAVLHLFEKADASTLPHEFFHIFRRHLKADELNTLGNFLEKQGFGKFNGEKPTVAQEEALARAFENFLVTNELHINAPTKLQQVFSKVKGWMGDIYQRLEGTPIPISKGVKRFFSTIKFDEPSANIFKDRLVEGARGLEADALAAQGKTNVPEIAPTEPITTKPTTAEVKPTEGKPQTKGLYDSAKSYISDKVSSLRGEDYSTFTNKEAFSEARGLIEKNYDDALSLATDPQIARGKAAVQNATALELIKDAQAKGELGKVQSLIKALAVRGKEAGQAAQILSSIAETSPEGVARYIDAQFSRLAEDVPPQRLKRAEDITKTLLDQVNETPEQLTMLFQKQTNASKKVVEKFTDRLNQAKTALDREQVIREFVGKQYEIPTLTAKASQKIYEITKDLQGKTGYERKEALALLKQYVGEQIPQGWGKKFAFVLRTFDLLNPGGGLMNTLSDLAYSSPVSLEALNDQLASGIDRAATPVLKKLGLSEGRSLVRPKVGEQLKEYKKNLGIAWRETAKGIDTTSVTEDALGLGSSVPFTNPVAKKAAKFADKWVKRLYGLTQMASFRTTYDESIRNQMKAAELNGKQLAEPTEQMLEQAQSEAEFRTLTNKNWLTDRLTDLQQLLNKPTGSKDFGIGTMQITYTKVPANLLLRPFHFSPLGFGKAAAQMIRGWRYKQTGGAKGKEFDQREFVRTFARATLGTGVTLAAGLLFARSGILVKQSHESDEKKLQKLQGEQGQKGYKLNIDAAARLIGSGFRDSEATKLQDGDLLLDYGFLQPWASLMNFAANLNENYEKVRKGEVEGSAWEIVKQIGDAGRDTITDDSVIEKLKEVGGLSALLDKDNDKQGSAVGKLATSTFTRFTPAVFRQARNYLDNTKRETDDPESTLEGTANTILNRWQDSIPGLSRGLPASKTTFGDDKERTTGGAPGIFRSFIASGKFSYYKADPETKYLLDTLVARTETGSKNPGSHVPTVPKEFDVDGKKVKPTPMEKATYQDLSGHVARDLVKRVTTSKNFFNLSSDGQGEFIASYVKDINEATKHEVFKTKSERKQQALKNVLPKNPEVFEHNISVVVEKEKAFKALERLPEFSKLNEEKQKSVKESLIRRFSNLRVKEANPGTDPVSKKYDLEGSKINLEKVQDDIDPETKIPYYLYDIIDDVQDREE